MIYFITAIFSGIISGMGIGGGTILIPSLLFLSDITQKEAQSINLICFLPSAAAALFIHAKNKTIETKILKPLIFFGIIGAATGSFLALKLDGDILQKMFGIFLVIMSFKEFFYTKNKD
jgi:uncharacterized membrane protein YfcA